MADDLDSIKKRLEEFVSTMPKSKLRVITELAGMPDEGFSWLILCVPPKAMMHGGTAQIWPDGIGGFQNATRVSIEATRAAAQEYIDDKIREQEKKNVKGGS
jgi:hypothetical protein